jgi:hypothetical protein
METVAYLGMLNDSTVIPINVDATEQDKIVLGGKSINLSKKDIDHIIRMTDQMNHRVKMIIRSSKKMNQENQKPSPAFLTNQGIKIFTEKKENYYKLNDTLRDSLKGLYDIKSEIIDDWDLGLNFDLLGFTSEKKNKIVAVHPFLSEYENLEPFSLSTNFYKGYMKGSTFNYMLSISTHHYRISQWYFILVLLTDPLREKYEEDGKETFKELKVSSTGENALIDILEIKENIVLIKQSIKRNIKKYNAHKLKDLLEQMSTKNLYNPFSRKMSVVDIFSKPGTATFKFTKNSEGGGSSLEIPESGLSVIEALEEKENFNKEKPTTFDFYRFSIVALDKIENPKKSLQESMERDHLSIKAHNERVVNLRNEMKKILLIEFIRKEIKCQINKLTQVGAHNV